MDEIIDILNKVSDNVEIQVFKMNAYHENIDYLLSKSEHTIKYYDDTSYLFKGVITLTKHYNDVVFGMNVERNHVIKFFNNNSDKYFMSSVWKYFGEKNNYLESFFVIRRISLVREKI